MSYQTEEAASILDGGVETFTPKKQSANKFYSLAALMVLCVAGASFRAGHSYGAAEATTSMVNLHNNLDLSTDLNLGFVCDDFFAWNSLVSAYCGGIPAVSCHYDAYVHHKKSFDGCPGSDLPMCADSIQPYLKNTCLN
mmetsp:Transcript_13688/g.31584  ORF Transcript_13688/g.31584 Transcript_13688/m.31584 type:complete len:139 (-) Transcript_13688:205-621(-)